MKIAFSIIACALMACFAIQSPQAGPVGFRLVSAASFSPANLQGLKLWFDASQITGLSDGDSVTNWFDLSGNSNTATQSTASKRFTYETGEINGLPIVRGDGVDDFFDISTPLSLTNYTVFAVVKRAAGSQGVLFGAEGAGSSYMGIYTTFGGTLQNENGSFAGNIAADPATAATWRFTASSGTASFGTNGSDSTFANPVTGAFRFGRIGNRAAGEHFSGDLGEVIVYDTALSVDSRQSVERYLRAKWGTP